MNNRTLKCSKVSESVIQSKEIVQTKGVVLFKKKKKLPRYIISVS